MYRIRHPRTGLYVIEVANPKPKFAGDIKAYWRYTLKDEEATTFERYAPAEMAEIMLGVKLDIVDETGLPVSREQAMLRGDFYSSDV